MITEKCFCKLGDYQVKDMVARREIDFLNNVLDEQLGKINKLFEEINFLNNVGDEQLEMINTLRKDVDFLIDTWEEELVTLPEIVAQLIARVDALAIKQDRDSENLANCIGNVSNLFKQVEQIKDDIENIKNDVDSGDGAEVESVLGTWTFKESIEPLPTCFEVSFVASNGREYYSMDNYGGGLLYLNDGEAETAYMDEWYTGFQTINIIEEPTNTEFITWLKANARKLESVVGVWVFNDELSVPGEMYDKTYHLSYSVNTPDGMKFTFVNMAFDYTGKVSFYDVLGFGLEPAYDNGWMEEHYKTIIITGGAIDETFINWLKANATKQITGT